MKTERWLLAGVVAGMLAAASAEAFVALSGHPDPGPWERAAQAGWACGLANAVLLAVVMSHRQRRAKREEER